mmetsp:Transcript_42092/g.127188  ORF Transcript_42092/g.127188 Transcript_42092/m.127188 type:complete len:224 (-) Transcript_42092:499-1170(-)
MAPSTGNAATTLLFSSMIGWPAGGRSCRMWARRRAGRNTVSGSTFTVQSAFFQKPSSLTWCHALYKLSTLTQEFQGPSWMNLDCSAPYTLKYSHWKMPARRSSAVDIKPSSSVPFITAMKQLSVVPVTSSPGPAGAMLYFPTASPSTDPSQASGVSPLTHTAVWASCLMQVVLSWQHCRVRVQSSSGHEHVMRCAERSPRVEQSQPLPLTHTPLHEAYSASCK